jgi:hypothetical protein
MESPDNSMTPKPDVRFQLSLLRLLSTGREAEGQIQEIERLLDQAPAA